METIHEWVVRLFPSPGWFVEAGAHDGIGDSATWALERAGWSGLCVEPSSAFAGLRVSRDCQVDNRALWSASGESVEFIEVAGNGIELSGLAEALDPDWRRAQLPHTIRRVETITLTDVLAQHGAPPFIEFLSLDVEGAEFEILAAHDFGRFSFGAISTEHNRVDVRRKEVRDLLAARGFRLAVANAWDVEDWFVGKGLANAAT
ncbi:MAG TPA: FkbM family methyltransferase [Phycisphaerae bacterium]|nr:FkbM family methyltransferase [Phycisphaerae bacterium]